jgi:D-alanyl-D-alanine carboxypeptidase
MKKFLLFILFFTLFNTNLAVRAKDNPPSVAADSVVLMDGTTGTILYSKNMDAAYPPASTTKVMTALLTIENAKMDEVVTVSKKVPYVDGSKIGLFEGEQLPVKDVLYGLLLMSGNDCAEALAEHVGGSLENFAKLMTERAKKLGCENTNFINPSGLYDDNHRTSAKDLALIMREAMKYPEFKQIVGTTIYKIPPTNMHPEGINLATENKIMYKNSKYYYEGAEGGKTGYTVQSRFSYVACATRNGQRLIATFVHDENKSYYTDTKALFDYGFKNFELVKLYNKGDTVSTYSEKDLSLPLIALEDYYYVREKSTSDKPEYSIQPFDLNDKSIKKGDAVAEATVTMNSKSLPNLKLASGADYEVKAAMSISDSISALKLDNKNSSPIYIVIGAAAALLILFILAVRIRVRRRNKRREINMFKYK